MPNIHQAKMGERSSSGTYYVNKFSNGEVWVSTSIIPAQGTRISTASPEDIKYLFVMLFDQAVAAVAVTEQKQAVAAEVVHLPTFAIDPGSRLVHRIYIGGGGAAEQGTQTERRRKLLNFLPLQTSTI